MIQQDRNLLDPVMEEGIISITGNIAIDNPRIEVYRYLERHNGEWIPKHSAESLQLIKQHIQQLHVKNRDIWERRCLWLINNIQDPNIRTMNRENILKYVDTKL